MPSLELPTHSLAYETRGNGPTILLLGGSGEPMIAWELCGLVDALVDAGHHVIWYAARGVLPSGCPPLPWSLAQMADDALALLDHLNVDRCIGIGYSLGGFTLEELVRREPPRVAAAMLIASAGAGAGGSATIREAFIDAENSFAESLGEVPVSFSRLMTLLTALGGPELTDAKLVAEWWELLGHQRSQWADPHGEVGQAQVAKDWTSQGSTTTRPWPRDVDSALVYFENDPLFPPAEAPQVVEHLGNALVEVVPRTGHAGLMNESARTIQAIMRILEAWQSPRPCSDAAPSPTR